MTVRASKFSHAARQMLVFALLTFVIVIIDGHLEIHTNELSQANKERLLSQYSHARSEQTASHAHCLAV